jgi:PhoPQ-activated pathogenicity-related protein
MNIVLKSVLNNLLLILITCFTASAQADISPSTALKRYLENGDKNYKWEVKETFEVADVTVYNLLLTSQKWRESIWKHQLTVMVPKGASYDAALLFITGGRIDEQGQPNWSSKTNGELLGMGMIAKQNKAVVAVLKQAPNQPLYNNLTEDALISFTLHNFKKDGDYTWPLLFPMVKSATSAMTAVQEVVQDKLKLKINRFVVSGASKRGWTTWLTAAVDKRVAAIAPMVIDMLNMPVSMNYQVKVWKEYSPQIEDYVKLGLVQDIGSGTSNALTTMIDPYSYRKMLTMPKMIIMGTNDQYWPVDNIKNYYDSIPGQNLIHYVPNVGHNLGDGTEALSSLSAFFSYTLAKQPYPICQWTSSVSAKGVKVAIKATADKLVDVIVWHADSPDLDFRNDKWQSTTLGIKQQATVEALEEFPPSGYRAFYVNLKYKDAKGGVYTESTRVFMTDTKKLY